MARDEGTNLAPCTVVLATSLVIAASEHFGATRGTTARYGGGGDAVY